MEVAEVATRKTIAVTRSRCIAVEWSLKLTPEVKVRRAPTSERGGRY
jgi:hypothetical protein